MTGAFAIERVAASDSSAVAGSGGLSVLVPAYNEEPTVGLVLRRLLLLPLPELEVVLVDDGSTDGTFAEARRARAEDPRVTLLRHDKNQGKGAAIRTALAHVRGDVVVIQDADLEYDPRDLLRMAALFASEEVEVVYGSRWSRHDSPRRWSSYLASRLLSALTNTLFGARLTDEPTGYKMFRAGLLRSLAFEANGFDFCPEVTARVLLSGAKIHEVPISYIPRGYREGKKISWCDGLKAVAVLIGLRLQRKSERRKPR